MATGELTTNTEHTIGGGMTPQIESIASLPPNLAVMRMENDNIMSLAASRPRSVALMRREIEEQLSAFPKQAAKLIFAKPVGREPDVCTKCGSECFRQKNGRRAINCFKCKSEEIKEGGQKFARGLSIRAAEMLAEVYGYNRVRSWMEPIDGDTIRVCASFTDYQKGRTWTDESILSRLYTTRNKEIVRHPDDRFYGVVARAQSSKVIREVVVRCVSAGLKAWLYDEAERLIDENLDDATIAKIISNFANKQVSQPMLERLIGRTIKEGWTKDDRKTLVGVWNAIDSGDESVASVFADVEKDDDEKPEADAEKKPTNGNGSTATNDALKKPTATKEESKREEQGKPADDKKPTKPSAFLSLSDRIEKATGDGELDVLSEEIASVKADGDLTDGQTKELNRLLTEKSKQLNEG